MNKNESKEASIFDENPGNPDADGDTEAAWNDLGYTQPQKKATTEPKKFKLRERQANSGVKIQSMNPAEAAAWREEQAKAVAAGKAEPIRQTYGGAAGGGKTHAVQQAAAAHGASDAVEKPEPQSPLRKRGRAAKKLDETMVWPQPPAAVVTRALPDLSFMDTPQPVREMPPPVSQPKAQQAAETGSRTIPRPAPDDPWPHPLAPGQPDPRTFEGALWLAQQGGAEVPHSTANRTAEAKQGAPVVGQPEIVLEPHQVYPPGVIETAMRQTPEGRRELAKAASQIDPRPLEIWVTGEDGKVRKSVGDEARKILADHRGVSAAPSHANMPCFIGEVGPTQASEAIRQTNTQCAACGTAVNSSELFSTGRCRFCAKYADPNSAEHAEAISKGWVPDDLHQRLQAMTKRATTVPPDQIVKADLMQEKKSEIRKAKRAKPKQLTDVAAIKKIDKIFTSLSDRDRRRVMDFVGGKYFGKEI